MLLIYSLFVSFFLLFFFFFFNDTATTEIYTLSLHDALPNSFDVPMKILFTDDTRPRISSGVTSCTIEPRMITLTLSNAPMRKSTPSDNQNTFDNPNRIVDTPNPITHQSNVSPECFIGGRCAMSSAITKAPTAGIARIQPRPTGPQ